jgi:pimeloyl-ACP methyl ester carboxylesterase
MRRTVSASFLLLLSGFGFAVLLSSPVPPPAPPAACALRFRITLSRNVAPEGASGRLLVFMSGAREKRATLATDFVPGDVWLAAMEVEHLAPGKTLDFDPNLKAYPRPFSQAPPGHYQFMALLDQDHSYARSGQDDDDLYGPVVARKALNPGGTAPIELSIDRCTPSGPRLTGTSEVKLAEFESPLLSGFWGRPIKMRAGLVLPPGYETEGALRYPAVYHVHGFGGSHAEAWQEGPRLVRAMKRGQFPPMVHVFLDGSFSTGHHEFADSVNNGPWGRALTEEFIPWLEQKWRLLPEGGSRFLTGHSSGGWSTLWLQVTYPDFFGGTWSTAPDPVDFRSFCGIDLTPGSTDNAYHTRDNKPRNLVRNHGKEVASVEAFSRQEEVEGGYGGQMASFEWVFSPKGPGGRPLKAYNRATGQLDPEVLKAWRKYDIRWQLDRNWAVLGPKLRGKLHLICGGDDTFHLEEAVKLLCASLKDKGSDAACEIVPDRTHMDLYRPYTTYPDGLDARIYREMGESYRRSTGAPSGGAAPPTSHVRFSVLQYQ